MKTTKFLSFLFLAFIISACTPKTIKQVVVDQNLAPQQVIEYPVDLSSVSAGEAREVVIPKEVEDEVEEPQAVVAEKFVQSVTLIDNDILFVSQAPYAIWDEFHQETCEEASMIMVVNFLDAKPLDKYIMEQGLIDLVSWQEKRGYKVDLDADEVVEILDQYFGHVASVLVNVSVERIIAELDAGNLLIAPAAGRNLGNPYFTAPGPIYHMLVIRGYDKATGEFITNDPGTKRGEAYRYSYSQLLDAVADWNHSLAVDGMTQDEIEQGRKVLILVNKPI